VLFLASEGIPAVATFGASVSDDQIRFLRKCQQGIKIAPDNDSPGEKFLEHLTEGLERYIPLWHIEPPEGEGEDIGDMTPAGAMGFSKFTRAEEAEVLSPNQHKAAQDELHRLGKTSARGLSEFERQSLKIALESTEESC
jgi:hypothetical protein